MQATLEVPESQAALETPVRENNPFVRDQVLDALGKPADLMRLQVNPLWQNHYRVNVYVGSNASSMRVAHSYFVRTDDAGTILTAAPPITRLY